MLLQNDYKDVLDKNGKVKYRIKECVDDFPYVITDPATGQKTTVKLREKRVVSFNPKLAQKQIFEINKEVEKAKLLKASQAKKSEYGDCAKYVTFSSTDKDGNDTDGKVKVTLNQKLIDKSIELAGYNMLITSEISMSQEAVYNAYHNLWRIEESFRIMKSQLDARPVYLQKKETITGHFLICYIAVLLTRIFQFRIMKNSCSSESVFEFMHDFKLAEISSKKYINLTRDTPFINDLSGLSDLPLTNYFLSESDIKKMLSHRF